MSHIQSQHKIDVLEARLTLALNEIAELTDANNCQRAKVIALIEKEETQQDRIRFLEHELDSYRPSKGRERFRVLLGFFVGLLVGYIGGVLALAGALK